MRQSFLIKIDVLQCFQFSLLPCNILLCNGYSRQRAFTHILIWSILFGKQYMIGTRIREVVSCAMFSVEIPCCFSLSMLQSRTAVTEWPCSCLGTEPSIFRCALTITGNAFVCSAVQVPTYRSCSQLFSSFNAWLQSFTLVLLMEHCKVFVDLARIGLCEWIELNALLHVSEAETGQDWSGGKWGCVCWWQLR